MTDNLHKDLNKLRIISRIKEGQKLDTTDTLHVYTETFWNWVWRKYNKDNKDKTVRYLQELYKNLQESIDVVIKNYQHAINEQQRQAQIANMINIAGELRASIEGLDNLSKTYSAYSSTVASLDGILKDYIIVTYTTLINTIPDDKIPDALKQNITYDGVVVYQK